MLTSGNPSERAKVRHTDIARLAGVSRTTVSYVLSRRSDVSISAATRRRVLGAASKLSYRQNELARSLARGSTRTIGVLTPALDMSFHAGLINGIQEACLERQYRVLLGYSHNDVDVERSELGLLLQHQVDAVILIAGRATCLCLEQWLGEAIVHEKTPCVILDHAMPGGGFDCVISDDRSGSMSAIQHLVERGHRRIAHIAAGRGSSPAVDRLEGYRMAVVGARLPLNPELIVGDSFTPESGAAAMTRLLELAHPPTAVFAASDYLALGAMEVLAQRGLRVPEDVAVVGFSDMGFAQYLQLTSVRRSPAEMGKAAMNRLLERIQHPDLAPANTVMPTQLVVRRSSGPHPRQAPGVGEHRDAFPAATPPEEST